MDPYLSPVMRQMAQPTNDKRSFAYIGAGILVAAVLVSAALILVFTSSSTETVTRISTITLAGGSAPTATFTTTLTSGFTGYMIADASGDAAFVNDCAVPNAEGERVPTLVTTTSSPAIMCVQFYDFNSTSPILLNLTTLLHIQGALPAVGPFSDATGGVNFTIAASQGQLLIGGPSNVNEGVVVGYMITAKPGVSGTYGVGFPGWRIGGAGGGTPATGDACTMGQLVAGGGEPDYRLEGSCIECSMVSSSSSTEANSATPFAIPGAGCVSSSTLFFQFIAETNSTQ